MNVILNEVKAELIALIHQLQTSIPNDEPFNVVHNNWTFPGVNRLDLTSLVTSLATEFERRIELPASEQDSLVRDFVRRLQYLRAHTVPNIWGNGGAGVPVLVFTLDALRLRLEQAYPQATIDSQAETAQELAQQVKRLQARLRGIDARLNEIEPKSSLLADMVIRIEQAHEAADQLPTDLEALGDARKKVGALLVDSQKNLGAIEALLKQAHDHDRTLLTSTTVASAVLAKCESAYSAATSQGLAAAFMERSKSLTTSMWVWVGGLVAALALGGFFGSHQLKQLTTLIQQPSAQLPMVLLNLFLAVFSVGAPVWFAWLATKQTGQRFRLAEDYAFKASISRAYEGYRKEAERIDPQLESRLLASALDRLDELPLRLVETSSHGSPLHELLGSLPIQEAAKSVPGFVSEVNSLAQRLLDAVAARKGAGKGGGELLAPIQN
jgi:chaperonin cofactor prefoldin